MGTHSIDTQALPPSRMPLGHLSYWEEIEENQQIHASVNLGNMCKSASKYACRVTLLVKKDGS